MTNPKNYLPNLPRLLRWLIYAVITILVVAGIAALALPSYLIKTLETQTMQQTGRKLTIDSLGLNLLTLTVDVNGIKFYEANQSDVAFSANELLLKISPASLLHLAPVVREVKLTQPRLQLMRAMQDGKEVTNFSDVIARFANQPSKGGDPVRFSVSNIQLGNGAIALDDRIAGKQVHIDELTLNVPFISNFRTKLDIFVEPYLSAKVDGSKLEIKGHTKPFASTLETNVAIDINRFNLTELVAFSPTPLPYTVKSALLSTQLTLNFSAQKDNQHISLSGTASLDDLALADKDGASLFTTKQINLNVQDADLVNQHVALNSLEVVEPQVWASLDKHGVLNWLPKQENKQASAKPIDKTPVATNASTDANKKAGQPLIELAHLQIKNGTAHWADAANATPAMELQIANIALDAQHISTKENADPASVTFSFGASGQPQLHFDGKVNPLKASASGQITLADFALEQYQPYVNQIMAANVSGTLALKTQLELQDGNVNLSAFSGSVDELNVQAKQHAYGGISAKKIALDNLSVNSASKLAKLEQLTIDDVRGDVFRDANGTINLMHLMNSMNSMKKPAQAITPAKASVHKAAVSHKDAPAWTAEINEVALNDSHFIFGDKSVKPAVMIKADDLNIKLSNISSKLDHPIKVAMRTTLNKTGKFAVDGSVAEKAMQLNVNVQNFAIAPLQPYFTEFLNISIAKGSVSTKGKLSWKAPAEIQFKGGFKLANLASVDKENAANFLTWKMLDISGIDVALGGKQPTITLGKIDLNNFYARAILSDQGKLNLQSIVVHPQADAAPATPSASAAADAPAASGNVAAVPAQPVQQTQAAQPAQTQTVAPDTKPVITIGEIDLNNGIINYTDNFVKPHYSMRMTGMKGKVGTIRSDQPQSAPIDIDGKVDDKAPIAISGSLNPLFSPMLLDMKLTAAGVDLPNLTTYALKYAGYPIVKGKLSLSVEYHIKDNKLDATNSLMIDQLTFGDKVEGPDATHLPVPFLVSLLTDSNNQINLDLPISGTLNDPQFSIGGLILKVFLNLIGKVITSPFSLLSHAFGGGGEEMAYVEFDPGSATLTQAAKDKLDKLAKVLVQKPQLKMDMTGRADMTVDNAGLREHILDSQIKKSRSMEAEDSDGSVISAADRARAIDKIYSDSKFDKPRNMIGFAKSIPPAEEEKLIIANTKITDDEIRALALRREAVVHAYLTDTEHITPDRLFTIAPKLSGDGIKDKGAISRVDFDLKM